MFREDDGGLLPGDNIAYPGREVLWGLEGGQEIWDWGSLDGLGIDVAASAAPAAHTLSPKSLQPLVIDAVSRNLGLHQCSAAHTVLVIKGHGKELRPDGVAPTGHVTCLGAAVVAYRSLRLVSWAQYGDSGISTVWVVSCRLSVGWAETWELTGCTQFCSAFFVLNWSIETRRSLIDYSFRILANANILFSILKSLKTTFLKRSLIGCDVKLTSQDMVTWQLYQPISGNGLYQYRMASTFLLVDFYDFQIFVLFSVVRPEDPDFKWHSKVTTKYKSS